MVDRRGEPRTGDAFGVLLHAALAEYSGTGLRPTYGGRARPVNESVEREDGFIAGNPAAVHLAYHQRNRVRGRMSGQLHLRVRYLDVATPWFDYLLYPGNDHAGLPRGVYVVEWITCLHPAQRPTRQGYSGLS